MPRKASIVIPGQPLTHDAAPRKRSPWILGPWHDLILLVATPLLIFPLVKLAKHAVRPMDIFLYVAAFGAFGHHLPGMLRAYGDRALFARYKVRFIVAPVFLLTVCVLCSRFDVTALTLAAITWGSWHGLMQIYGFLRIYDAKTSVFSTVTRRLDLAMCIAWFGAGMILSPTYLFSVLKKYHIECGGPLIPGVTVDDIQAFWTAVTVIVTVLFAANLIWNWVHGRTPNWVKLLLMATSFTFWWYVRVIEADPLIAVALFEIFHDVQYLTIVWVYNHNRATQDSKVGGFMRFVFLRSGALVGVYLGLVFSYGAIGYLGKGFSVENVTEMFQGVLLASGLLHFYYDGFIWRVREKSTRQGLGLRGGDAPVAAGRLPAGLGHIMRWSLFIAPLLWLGYSERSQADTQLLRFQVIASQMPESLSAQHGYGEALVDAGKPQEAANVFKKILVIKPEAIETRNNLGIVLAQLGETDQAIDCFDKVLQLVPDHVEALTNMGLAHAQQGNLNQALKFYDAALLINPHFELAQDNRERLVARFNSDLTQQRNARAVALAKQGLAQEAIDVLFELLQADPQSIEAHNNLGIILTGLGRREEALTHYLHALRLDPQAVSTHVNVSLLLIQLGDFPQAEHHILTAIQQQPNLPQAHNARGLLFSAKGNSQGAIDAYRKALKNNPNYGEARGNLERELKGLQKKTP